MGNLKILINGASGKMGRAMGGGISQEPDLDIAAAVDVKGDGADFGLMCGLEPMGVYLENDLGKAILRTKPDIMVVFTHPQAVVKSVRIALTNKVACVIGTTGLNQQELDEIKNMTAEYATPVFIAPNFALGAVLMMRFAQEAAKYFPHAEVIEYHHDQKLDAPSGTAVATLEKIAKVREIFAQGDNNEFEKIPGSRGGDYQGMRVHSLRLPGYVATQDVIFGGIGQRLVIKHDTISRESFLPGVLMAVRKVLELEGFVSGLDSIMDLD